jgi:hypothetical protein
MLPWWPSGAVGDWPAAAEFVHDLQIVLAALGAKLRLEPGGQRDVWIIGLQRFHTGP